MPAGAADAVAALRGVTVRIDSGRLACIRAAWGRQRGMNQPRGGRGRKRGRKGFPDLGLSNPEEAPAKAKLAHRICQVIAQRGLTQAAAARLRGLDQPKVSALVRGKPKGFSVGRLF